MDTVAIFRDLRVLVLLNTGWASAAASLSPNRNDKQKKKKRICCHYLGPACLPHNILRDTVRYHFQPESTRRQSFGGIDVQRGLLLWVCCEPLPHLADSVPIYGEALLIKPQSELSERHWSGKKRGTMPIRSGTWVSRYASGKRQVMQQPYERR